MADAVEKKHLLDLDPYKGSPNGGVVHFAKDGTDYKLPVETLSGNRLSPRGLTLTPTPVMAVAPNARLVKGTGISGLSIQAPGTGYAVGNYLTIAGGVADTAGVVYVTGVNSEGGITSVAVTRPGIYTATPTNPVDVTGGAGSGAKLTLSYNASVATAISNRLAWSRTDAAFDYWGYSISDITPGYRGNGVGNGTQCVVEFDSDAPLLEFRFIGSNSYYDLYVDGQRIKNVSEHTDTSGAPYQYIVDWSGVAVPRHYRLVGINTGFGGVNTDVKYAIWKSPEYRGPRVWQFGDSYTYGTMATQGSFTDFRLVCDALGLNGIADGIGGSGWSSTGSTQPQQRIQSKLSTITYLPDLIFLSLGYNDAAAGRLDVVDTNFRESVALIRQLAPNAQIYVIGPATPVGATTQLDNIRTTIMTACTDLSLPFIDIRNWVNSANKSLYTANDNVHPTDAGYWYRGARLTQVFSTLL